MRLAGQGLGCVRGGREIFSGLDFAVPAGQALAVTGINGAGKSSILRVMAGEPVISPQMMAKLVTAVRQQPGAAPVAAATAAAEAPALTDAPPDGLSAREREILLLIARGHSNKLIARQLDIAETTVKIHVQHILRKLQLTSRVQAAVYATSRGWA